MTTHEKVDFDVAVVGGGLGGLVLSHLLTDSGFSVAVFEKKRYPFHRVCGEYISNEVIPFLQRNDLFPQELAPSTIKKFQLTSISGNSLEMPLDLGGFGIGRYAFDHWLAKKLTAKKASLFEGTTIRNIEKRGGTYCIQASDDSTYLAKLAVGSYGKRSSIDKKLDRPFLKKQSPYIGVKYHIETDFDDSTVALHNFRGGYCGINKIEGNKYNLCYLSERKNLKKSGTIAKMESDILSENPHLNKIWKEAHFLFDKPEVINEISFEKKGALFNDIPMVGDAAGMITPLCGNGMAMAIHSASILAQIIQKYPDEQEVINRTYQAEWSSAFSSRLWAGRKIQGLFGGGRSSNFAVRLGQQIRPAAQFLMSKTHGQVF